LEEGLRDDGDLSRHAILEVPESWNITQWKDRWTGKQISSHDPIIPLDLSQASSVLIEASK
jgi:hypothetical protein